MFGDMIRSIAVFAILTAVLVGGITGLAAAAEADDELEPCECLEEPDDEPLVVTPVYFEALETPVATPASEGGREDFSQAKRAYHEARQEIQAVKKGNESPVEEVPTFFDDGDETEDDE